MDLRNKLKGAWRPLRQRVYHIFFGLSLVTLVALGTWWWIFMNHAIADRHASELDRLSMRAEQYAVLLGHAPKRPDGRFLKPDSGLVITGVDRAPEGAMALAPRWADMAVGIDPARRTAIEDKYRRQRVMWLGEGTLLFSLLLVSVAMLYRLVYAEIRFRRAMDQFLNQVTHELKTPIAGIRSLLQSVSLGRVPPAQMPHLLNLGMTNVERLEHLIENILVRNRLRSHRFTPPLTPVDLGALARQVIDHRLQLGLNQEMPGLEIKTRTKAAADGESVRVILENLLDNAEKYSRGESVRVRVAEDGDQIVLSVEDRGVGIAPEHIHEIFKPYFRVEQPVNGVLHGSGLGLDICRMLSGRMGGTIEAFSEGREMGARFELRLRKAA